MTVAALPVLSAALAPDPAWHLPPLSVLSTVLVDVALIVVVSRLLGRLMHRLGPPPVIGELVVLNVGVSLGVIGPALFTVMVLMALITTAMAGPLLGRLGYGPMGAGA